VATEIGSQMPEKERQPYLQRIAGIEQLEAQDIADAIAFLVTRPRHVAVNEVLIRPTDEE
jgi:NADP-dependent 3-hydroxy acid dehydrogenase YdfG